MNALLIAVTSFFIQPQMEKIAIIDTGLDYTYAKKICDSGHYDFVSKSRRLGPDYRGHGTNIAAILINEIQKKNYCLMIFRVIGKNTVVDVSTLTQAVYKAVKNGATIINLSFAGEDGYDFIEEKALKYAISQGVKIYVAAGNEGANLDTLCNIYPACYGIEGMNVVGALDKNGKPQKYSNKGKIVNMWFQDENPYHLKKVGTSMAVPRAIVEEINE